MSLTLSATLEARATLEALLCVDVPVVHVAELLSSRARLMHGNFAEREDSSENTGQIKCL